MTVVHSTDIPRVDMVALRVLSVAYFVQAVGALAVVGSLAPIAQTWGLSDAQAAYLVSVFGFAFALAAPVLQMVLGHLRRRAQVLGGLVLFSSAALLAAAAPGYGTLLTARVLMGLGAAFIGPVLGALGSGLVAREHQGSAIAIVLMGLSVAGLAGLPLGAWIAHAWGARALFLCVGLAGLAAALAIARLVPDTVAGVRTAPRELADLLLDRRMLVALLVVTFLAAGVYATVGFLSPIVLQVYQAGPGGLTTALVVLGAAGVLGNLGVTYAARRYSADRLLVVALAVLAAVLVLIWLAPARLPWLLVLLVPWAFATDIAWPSQQRRIVELRPAQRGIGLALTASFMFAGIGLGTATAGHAYAAGGVAGLLVASLVFIALAAACLVLSRR